MAGPILRSVQARYRRDRVVSDSASDCCSLFLDICKFTN